MTTISGNNIIVHAVVIVFVLCQDGLVSCHRLTCPKLECEAGLAEYHTKGDCCAKCVSEDLLGCSYEGKGYQVSTQLSSR